MFFPHYPHLSGLFVIILTINFIILFHLVLSHQHPPGHYVAFKLREELPRDTAVMVVLDQGTSSAEGKENAHITQTRTLTLTCTYTQTRSGVVRARVYKVRKQCGTKRPYTMHGPICVLIVIFIIFYYCTHISSHTHAQIHAHAHATRANMLL